MGTVPMELCWNDIRLGDRSEGSMDDTVLFTDHGILIFAITTGVIAVMLSALGFATTPRAHSDIEHQLNGLR